MKIAYKNLKPYGSFTTMLTNPEVISCVNNSFSDMNHLYLHAS